MEQKSEIVLYQPEGSVSLEVRLENETVWLTQQQMSELFQTTKQNISLHTGNIFKEKELDRDSVVKESFTTASDGKSYRTKYYNLDVIISVGYRVKSQRGTQFRQWANKVLKEYMLKGYSINQKLDNLEKRIDNRLREHDSEIQRLSNQVDFFYPPFLTADRGNIFCRPDIQRLQIRLRSCQVSPKEYRPFRQLHRRVCLDFIRETRKIGIGGDLYG